MRRCQWTEATTTSSSASRSSSWSRLPSSRMSTSIPVSSRKPVHRSLSRATTCSWLLEPAAIEPARHAQPGRVVGQRQVPVTERPGGLGHLLDAAAAVAPVRVRVQVAAQRRDEGGTDAWVRCGHRPQSCQVLGHLAARRHLDHRARHGADPGHVAQRAAAQSCGQLRRVEAGQRRCRSPERPHPVCLGQLALEQERALGQRGDGGPPPLDVVHGPSVGPRTRAWGSR